MDLCHPICQLVATLSVKVSRRYVNGVAVHLTDMTAKNRHLPYPMAAWQKNRHFISIRKEFLFFPPAQQTQIGLQCFGTLADIFVWQPWGPCSRHLKIVLICYCLLFQYMLDLISVLSEKYRLRYILSGIVRWLFGIFGDHQRIFINVTQVQRDEPTRKDWSDDSVLPWPDLLQANVTIKYPHNIRANNKRIRYLISILLACQK